MNRNSTQTTPTFCILQHLNLYRLQSILYCVKWNHNFCSFNANRMWYVWSICMKLNIWPVINWIWSCSGTSSLLINSERWKWLYWSKSTYSFLLWAAYFYTSTINMLKFIRKYSYISTLFILNDVSSKIGNCDLTTREQSWLSVLATQ